MGMWVNVCIVDDLSVCLLTVIRAVPLLSLHEHRQGPCANAHSVVHDEKYHILAHCVNVESIVV